MTRRHFVGLCAAVRTWAGAATSSVAAAAAPAVFSCQYRAKATVLMLSVPLLHRDGVGAGYLRVGRGSAAGGKRTLRLEFGAGSLPDRAAGLNRFGIFEETIIESGGGELESAQYFGYMSASNEKDLSEAKSAMKDSGEGARFTAIEGHAQPGRLSNRVLHLTGLPSANWSGRETLTAKIRQAFASQQPAGVQPQSTVCSPFLYAVHQAMRASQEPGRRPFLHNGKPHELRTSLKGDSGGHREIEGSIHDGKGKELSKFRLWFDPAKPEEGPVRFEFRPRSFLRLTFERVA